MPPELFKLKVWRRRHVQHNHAGSPNVDLVLVARVGFGGLFGCDELDVDISRRGASFCYRQLFVKFDRVEVCKSYGALRIEHNRGSVYASVHCVGIE